MNSKYTLVYVSRTNSQWVQYYFPSRLIDLEAKVPSLPQQMLYCRADAVAKIEYSRRVLILPVCGHGVAKDQQCLLMSKRLSCSCDGFCGAREQEAGAHVTYRLADGNLERIRRLFSNLQRFAWRRLEMVRFLCSQPLTFLQWIVSTIAKLNKMPV